MVTSVRERKRSSQFQWYWELLYILMRRSLKRRYRGSFLGIYWSLLNPLIMTGLYTAVFGSAFASYYNNSTLNYVLAAFTGLIVINFFSASTSQALTSVVENGAIVNKISLPLTVFPLSLIGSNVFQLSLGVVPLLIIITFWFSHSVLNAVVLFLPLLALILVSTGIGLLVSALYVFFRDLPYFYELITFVLWISCPVFYPEDLPPPSVKTFLILNPLIPIISSIRQISLSGNLPDFALIAQALIGGLIILTLGWLCFRWWQPQFMDLL